MNKNTIIFLVIAVVILGAVLLPSDKPSTEDTTAKEENVVSTPSTDTSANTTNVVTPTSATKTTAPKPVSPVSSSVASKDTGRVVFLIADEAVGLETLQSIMITVKEVSVNNSKGAWVTISNTPRVFNLLKLYLDARKELLADLHIPMGTYSQLRLSIDKVEVTEKGGLKAVTAKLPSQTLTFNTKLVIEKGKTSGVILDIVSQKSLHKTGNGTLMFFPVVKLSTQHGIGAVQTLSGNVELVNGLTDFDQSWGVDENGILKAGHSFGQGTRMELVGKTTRIIPSDEKSGDIKVSAETAIDTAVKGGYITEATSIQTVVREKARVWQIVGPKGNTSVTVFVDITTGAVVASQ